MIEHHIQRRPLLKVILGSNPDPGEWPTFMRGKMTELLMKPSLELP